jgi:integrase/recombinase XerD
MFDQLFERPHALARHRAGPLLKERLAFLTHLAKDGLPSRTLRSTAQVVLVVAKSLRLASRVGDVITRDEIKRKAGNKNRFYTVAVQWLQFLGRLHQQPAPVSPYTKKIKAFADYMEHERGLSPETIRGRCWFVPRFLNKLSTTSSSLREITPHRIDVALQELLSPGGYSRVSIRGWASVLRAFFRFAETRGWCRKGLADSIRGPHVFSQASLPTGPSWDDVRRLLAMTEGNRGPDIRARAILMLLAIYGLRAGEVNHLRLDDFDWERELFTVATSKTRRIRTYPLTRSVGDAILRYLQEVRPHSSRRELFLTLHAPARPLRHVWGLVAKRLRSLNTSLPHHGPHALRHACAARLLAQGLSLKEIGDHLGHSDPDATRIYAKVDLIGLRQVADFDLGGLL